MNRPVEQGARTSEPAAGWTLIATGILTILLMAQHREGGDGGVMTPLVHGGLQAVIIVQLAAFVTVARSQGRSLVMNTALLFIAAGQIAGLGAATINGFVVPELAAYPAQEIGPDIGRLAWEANQALARLGVVAIGTGFALWSVLLWKNAQKGLALAGWSAGLIPALLIGSGHIGMHLHGALFAYLTQAAWVIALGWSFTRRSNA